MDAGAEVMDGGPPPPKASPPWAWIALAAVVVVAIGVGAAVATSTEPDGQAADDAEVLLVQLEPVGHTSPAPFATSTVTLNAGTTSGEGGGVASTDPDPATDVRGRLTVGATPGGHPGLYGSSAAGAVCDRDALVEALDAAPDVRATWAALAGVADTEVAATIGTMTPLVLQRDTAVTNHLYRNGGGTAYQAILQAGTAVLVDDRGTPRVQCSCGNPLLAPALEDGAATELDGDGWEGFDPAEVVTVEAETEPLATFETVDVDTGAPDSVAPAGPGLELDGYLVDDDAGVHVVTPDGDLTTVLDHPVAVVHDDGGGGLIFQHRRDPETVPDWAAGSLAHRRPTTEAQAAVWHLPAGADEPVELLGGSDPGRRWHVAFTSATWQDRRVLAYAEMSHDPAAPEEEATQGTIKLRDLETGAEQTVLGPVALYEGSFGPVTISGDRLAVDLSYDEAVWDLYDGDLNLLPGGCQYPDEGASECASPAVLRTPDEFTGLHVDETGFPFSVLHIDARAGEITGVVDLGAVADDAASPPRGLDTWGDEVVVWWSAGGGEATRTLVHDLAGGDTTLLPVGGRTTILRSPLIRPESTVEAREPALAADTTPEPTEEAPATATEVRRVVPLTDDDTVDSPFSVGAPEGTVDCDVVSPSSVSVGPDVVSCGSTADGADVCWVRADRTTLLCGTEPWTPELRTLRSSRPLEPVAAAPDPLPWGLELDDGTRCRVRSGGSWGGRSDGWNGAYWCERSDGTSGEDLVVLADPDGPVVDDAAPRWTVHVGGLGLPDEEFPPPRPMAVAVAWFAATEP